MKEEDEDVVKDGFKLIVGMILISFFTVVLTVYYVLRGCVKPWMTPHTE